MKYLKQPTTSLYCGPIALLNVLKWAGLGVSYGKDFKRIQKLCMYENGFGCEESHLFKAIKKYKSLRLCRVSHGNNLSLRDLDRHIDQGGCFILLYWKKEQFGHYVVCHKRTKKFYYLINDDGFKVISKINRKKMKKITRLRSNFENRPFLIFILKKKRGFYL